MIRALALALLAATGARAAVAPPPGAVATLSEAEAVGDVRVATGPYADGLPAVTAEGAVTRRVWQVPDPGSSLALLRPLRAALEEDGWEVVFSCADRGCGGFEFRFELDVAPAPEMFVDLADYRYLAARRGEAWTILIASRSGARGYLQATEVTPLAGAQAEPPPAPDGAEGSAEGPPPPAPAAAAPPLAPPPAGDLARALRETGHAVLAGLDFASGSTALEGDAASLADLAAYLAAEPYATLALVGHTDATGSSEGNLAVSLARARSVRDALIDRHGVAPGRLEARGVGYYAPIAPNATEEGRRANRRVEAVVTSVP